MDISEERQLQIERIYLFIYFLWRAVAGRLPVLELAMRPHLLQECLLHGANNFSPGLDCTSVLAVVLEAWHWSNVASQ